MMFCGRVEKLYAEQGNIQAEMKAQRENLQCRLTAIRPHRPSIYGEIGRQNRGGVLEEKNFRMPA